jgi:hypothetical protein
MVGPDGNPAYPNSSVEVIYDDALGLCSFISLGAAFSSNDLFGYCITQLDGKTYKRASVPNVTFFNKFVVDLQRPGEYLVRFTVFANFYLFDKHSGSVGDLLPVSLAGVTPMQVRASDRFLAVIVNSVWSVPTTGGTAAIEATVAGGTGSITISRTRKLSVLCVAYQNGKIIYYDIDAKAQVGPTSWIGANDAAWYSPKHEIIVAYTGSQLNIYSATAVRPVALSNPAAVAALIQGRVGQVRCQLTGSNSDACVGELVNWSITGGLGALKAAQTKTDDSGWAYNDLIAPVTGFGSVTIQAQANF